VRAVGASPAMLTDPESRCGGRFVIRSLQVSLLGSVAHGQGLEGHECCTQSLHCMYVVFKSNNISPNREKEG